MDAENRSDQQKNFDHWLDSALQARANAEPRVGLENRVLARLASDSQHRIVFWPMMATAVIALVAIAIAVALLYRPHAERAIGHATTEPANVSGVNSAPVQASSTTKTPGLSKARNAQSIRGEHVPCCDLAHLSAIRNAEAHLPKLATFPAPRPETQQERLLAQLANQLVVRKEFSEIARLSVDSPPKDLSIQELSVEPLTTTSGSSSPQE